MPIAKAQAFERILMHLAILRYIFKSKAKQGHFDLNKHAETFFQDVLNMVYELSLVNVNRIQKNYPAIDLGDAKAGRCFQITGQNDAKKIEDTIQTFVKHSLQKTYPRLDFLIITDKKAYRKEFSSKQFPFAPNKNILDIDDLLTEIEGLPPDRLAALDEYIANQVRPMFASLAEPTSIFASAESAPSLPPKSCIEYMLSCGFEEGDEYWDDEVNSVQQLYRKLQHLSRAARDFMAFIAVKGHVERGMPKRIKISPEELDNLSGLDRSKSSARYAVLDQAGLIDNNEGDYPPLIELRWTLPSGTDFFVNLKEFLKDDEASLRRVLVEGDFTLLD